MPIVKESVLQANSTTRQGCVEVADEDGYNDEEVEDDNGNFGDDSFEDDGDDVDDDEEYCVPVEVQFQFRLSL